MRIESAQITDPRQPGVRGKRPYLTVFVEELPVPTNDTEKQVFGTIEYTSAKYGPFIEFTAEPATPDLPWTNEARHAFFGQSPSGMFNVAFRDSFAPVVDVVIMYDGHALEGFWALQLRRARTLIKKNHLPWRLLLSDYDAVKGHVAWVPVADPLKCMFHGLHSSAACYSREIDTTVTLNGVDYPLCKTHREQHNKRHARLRVESSIS